MSRKREKPYPSSTRSHLHHPYSNPNPKRRRHLPTLAADPPPPEKPAPPPAVLIIGLPPNCSVLDLKSRFEIYGPISRIRIDPDGVGSVNFRSKSSADEAITASQDPSFGISIDSHKVQVMWANQTNVGVEEVREQREKRNSMASKLLKGSPPLRSHGRGSRLSSAIVNPNTDSRNSSVLDPPLKPREIIAYDDIL